MRNICEIALSLSVARNKKCSVSMLVTRYCIIAQIVTQFRTDWMNVNSKKSIFCAKNVVVALQSNCAWPHELNVLQFIRTWNGPNSCVKCKPCVCLLNITRASHRKKLANFLLLLKLSFQCVCPFLYPKMQKNARVFFSLAMRNWRTHIMNNFIWALWCL